VSIPVTDICGLGVDLATHGLLTRFDTLAFSFTPDGVPQKMVLEKGSGRPYLRILFQDK
jgi:hypothetical protein